MARKTLDPVQSARQKQCSWNDHGHRCEDEGCLSDTVHGQGPWYCRPHYADLKGWPRWKAGTDADPMSEVDKRVNRLVPRLEGESEHDWSMRCKDWVLSRIKRGVLRSREPGEDMEEAA